MSAFNLRCGKNFVGGISGKLLRASLQQIYFSTVFHYSMLSFPYYCVLCVCDRFCFRFYVLVFHFNLPSDFSFSSFALLLLSVFFIYNLHNVLLLVLQALDMDGRPNAQLASWSESHSVSLVSQPFTLVFSLPVSLSTTTQATTLQLPLNSYHAVEWLYCIILNPVSSLPSGPSRSSVRCSRCCETVAGCLLPSIHHYSLYIFLLSFA